MLSSSWRGVRGGPSGQISGDDLHAAAGDLNLLPQEVGSIGFRVAEVFEYAPVPTVSDWGFVAMTLLGLTTGTLVFTRQQRHRA